MTSSWILPFITDHPVAAFFLSWPLMMVLVSMAWLVAASTENAMNLVLRMSTLLCNTFVLTIRGYAPQSKEAQPEDDTSNP